MREDRCVNRRSRRFGGCDRPVADLDRRRRGDLIEPLFLRIPAYLFARCAISAHPWSRETEWGLDFHKTAYKRFGRSAIWNIIAKDLPFPDNRVTIDATLKDEDDIAASKVDNRYDDGMKLQKVYTEEGDDLHARRWRLRNIGGRL